MQEFSSISVSSYEAGSLTDQLTEQSAAGWSVVAIVPTGSTVTAYLSRDADTSSDTSDTSDTSGAPAAVDAPEAVDAGAGAVSEPVLASTTAEPADEPAAPEPTAVSPGWAAGLDTSTTSDTTDQADTEHFTVADEPAPEPAPAAEPAAEAATATMATAAAGAAPAGWYADPSSRFELRYWDGSQWTEHVSRAGQQYTDPPVA